MDKLIECDLAVIGGGPAGLSAAIEASKAGCQVILIDENLRIGGQLFKQIHRFFGSKEHFAGARGFNIGNEMIDEVKKLKVDVWLNSYIFGIFHNNKMGIVRNNELIEMKWRSIIIATGAMEKTLCFPGWTLPGVMGAGAIQTFINIHRVRPGSRFLVVGSGNVGLIVAYQLLQGGMEIAAIVEAMDHIGGYAVHAAKLLREGVPIITSHIIKEALGKEEVESAVIARIDKPSMNKHEKFEVDSICIAAGLAPQIELPLMAGCEVAYIPELGGWCPIHDEYLETTMPGIFVAGDVTGVEEASTAIEEGRLAAIAVAETLGKLSKNQGKELKLIVIDRLKSLRKGSFGNPKSMGKKKLLMRMRNFNSKFLNNVNS